MPIDNKPWEESFLPNRSPAENLSLGDSKTDIQRKIQQPDPRFAITPVEPPKVTPVQRTLPSKQPVPAPSPVTRNPLGISDVGRYAETARMMQAQNQNPIVAGRMEQRRLDSQSRKLERTRSGLLGAFGSGLETAGAAIAATTRTLSGDLAGVEEAARFGDQIAKTPEQVAFSDAIAKHSQAGGDDSIWQGIKNVAAAAWEQPTGALHEMIAQSPNSAVVLGGMWAGAKAGAVAGSFAGPAGSVAGAVLGVAGTVVGMIAGNTAIEMGHMAMQRGRDGFTDAERYETIAKGAAKGTFIGLVDTATLGINKFLFGAPGRVAERAVRKSLTEAGVDMTSGAAVRQALANPDILQNALIAGTTALRQASTLGKEVGRRAGAVALESIGEGVGEYGGELAAGNDPSFTEAALEGLMSLPQSAIETSISKNLVTPGKMTQEVLTAAQQDKRQATPTGSVVTQTGDVGHIPTEPVQAAPEPVTEPVKPEVSPDAVNRTQERVEIQKEAAYEARAKEKEKEAKKLFDKQYVQAQKALSAEQEAETTAMAQEKKKLQETAQAQPTAMELAIKKAGGKEAIKTVQEPPKIERPKMLRSKKVMEAIDKVEKGGDLRQVEQELRQVAEETKSENVQKQAIKVADQIAKVADERGIPPIPVAEKTTENLQLEQEVTKPETPVEKPEAKMAVKEEPKKGFQDSRLKRDIYQMGLQQKADELVPGGGINIVGQKFHEEFPVAGEKQDVGTFRTQSLNPGWFQSMQENPDFQNVSVTVKGKKKTGVKAYREIIRRALSGEPVTGVTQMKVLDSILNDIKDEKNGVYEGRTELKDQIQKEREMGWQLRKQIKATEPTSEWTPAENQDLFQEKEYEPDWNGEARTIYELMDEARNLGDAQANEAESILESGRSNGEVAAALYDVIKRGRNEQATTEAVTTGEGAAEVPAGEVQARPEGEAQAELPQAGEEVAPTKLQELQTQYDEAKSKLDAIGKEPFKPSSEKKAFGTQGRENASAEAVARYDEQVKTYRSWKRKYSKLKKLEVDAANALHREKSAFKLSQEVSGQPTETGTGVANPQIEKALDTLEADTFTLAKPKGEVTTEAEKQGDMLAETTPAKKKAFTRKELIAPGIKEAAPTPTSRPIFNQIMEFVNINKDGTLERNADKETAIESFTDNGNVIFRHNKYPDKKSIPLDEVIKMYNRGERWVDIAPTETAVKDTFTTEDIINEFEGNKRVEPEDAYLVADFLPNEGRNDTYTKAEKDSAIVKAFTAATRAKRERSGKDLIAANNGKIVGLEASNREGTLHAAIFKDMSGQGKYRVQNYDENGFSGHQVYNSEQEALKQMIADGYVVPAKGAMDRLQGTAKWNKGMAIADQIRGVEPTTAKAKKEQSLLEPKNLEKDFKEKIKVAEKEQTTKRMKSENVFPAPEKSVNFTTRKLKEVSQKEADNVISRWRAEAKRIGETEDHSNEVVISLFDQSGEWSKPWEDAGYDVIRMDIKNGRDVVAFSPLTEIQMLQEAGKEIVGIMSACPCTSFSAAGAQFWKTQHDVNDIEMVRKKYGDFAAEYFKSPLEYAQTLVAITQTAVEFANPTLFHVLENPVGRIAVQKKPVRKVINEGIPEKPTLIFHPHNFGNPYTKKTQLWGKFNTNLPVNNVSAKEGSKMHKLTGFTEADKEARSLTPEGFAYAFFMANAPTANIESLPETGIPKTKPNMGEFNRELFVGESVHVSSIGEDAQLIGFNKEADRAVVEYIDEKGNDVQSWVDSDDLVPLSDNPPTEKELKKLWNELDARTEIPDKKLLKEIPKGEKPKFSRTTTTSIGKYSVRDVANHASNLMEGWKGRPDTRVVRTERDLPIEVRRHIKKIGAENTVDGVYWKGRAYIVASRMQSLEQVERTVFEEVLGHHGLRGMLGNEINVVLDQVWNKYGRTKLQGVIDRYFTGENKFDINNANDRRLVAEEHLTDLIQANKAPPNIMKRIYAAVRKWLRTHGFTRFGIVKELSDTEIDVLLSNARDFVQKGEVVTLASKLPAFSRKGLIQNILDPDNKNDPIVKAFREIGETQRGKPEAAMRKYQQHNSGVLGYALEHIGDLTHRMTDAVPYYEYDHGDVSDKVNKILRSLTSGYGFEREHKQNLVSNARFDNVDLDTFTNKSDELLKIYVNEHKKLPVYNRAQWLARESAISLGENKFDKAITYLESLKNLTDNKETYVLAAGQYVTDSKGNLIEYDSSDPMFSRIELKRTENFNKWFKNSKVVDENGEPLEVYHGTTRDWTIFDNSKTNPENDWGSAAYFTNTIADADANYAGEGPDLTGRLERAAEGWYDYIHDNLEEFNLTYETATAEIVQDLAMQEARKQLTEHKGMIIPAYLSFQNPVQYGGENETTFTYEENYDEEADEWSEPVGTLVDYLDALDSASYDFDMSRDTVDELKGEILQVAMDWNEISVTDLVKIIKESAAFMDAIDYNGEIAGGEFVRRSFENAGFDGVIDYEVPRKFGPGREFGRGMAGMDYDTVHYIAFKPNQIKSSIGNSGDYSLSSDDIRFAIRSPVDVLTSASDAVRNIDVSSNGVAKKVKDWVRRNFTKEGWTNTETFESRIKMHSLKNVGEQEAAAFTRDLENVAARVFGVKRYDQISAENRELMNSYLIAKAEEKADIAAQLPNEVVDTLDVLRGHIDRLSNGMLSAIRDMLRIQRGKLSARQQDQFDRFIASNGADGSLPRSMQRHFNLYQTILDNKGSYLNRSYQAFDDPQWLDKVKKNADLMERAKNFMREQIIARDAKKIASDMRFDPEAYGFDEDTSSEDIKDAATAMAEEQLTEDEVIGAVYNVVQNALDKGTFLDLVSKGTKEGSKDISLIMKRNNDIPPVIKELLGEYLDPKLNFIRSATKMSWYIANHHFLMDLRNKGLGKFIYEKPTGDFSAELAKESSEPMNPLNGTYSTTEYRQGLIDALDKFDGSDLMRQIIAMNSVVKYGKTILAPTTQFRNFMSAAMFSVMNGHFDWSHGGTAARVAKSDLFTKDSSWRSYINELIGLGVLHDNPYAGELRDAIKDYTDAYSLEGNAVTRKLKLGLDFFQRAYQVGDDFWKIIGYENELSRQLDRGLSLQEAKEKAAYRIRNGYPTYSMVPRGIKKIRRWPLIGSFVSFPYEMVRTTYNQIGFMREDMADGDTASVTRRAIGMGLASSASYAASVASMMMMGMDGDDDEAIRAQLPEWSRNAQLVYTGYDKNGMPTYIDLSYFDPYTYIKTPITAIMNGNNEGIQEKITDAMKSFLEPFIGVDIAAGAAIEIATNKTATGGTVYNPEDSDYGKTMSILNHARKAVQPGILSNVERTYKALIGDASRSGKQYDLGDELFAWIGWRFGTLNIPQSIIYKAYGFKDQKSMSTRLLSYTAGSGAKVSERELARAVRTMINSREEAYTDMSKLVAGAMKLGVSRTDIYSTLRAANVSKDDIRSLLSGTVPQWNMTSTFLKSATQRANVSAVNAKRRRELALEMMQRRRFINSYAKEVYSERK